MSNQSSANKSIVEERDAAVAERDQLQANCSTLKKNCTQLEKEKAAALEEKEKALTKVQEVNMKYDSAQLQVICIYTEFVSRGLIHLSSFWMCNSTYGIDIIALKY